jgi:nitrite reductase/ring-hydroxylating ferredoxin subunit
MFSRLMNLLRGRALQIPDTQRIPEGEGRKVEIGDPLAGGRSILLCRVDGELHALDDHCPHEQGGRLAPGPLVDGRWARCPLHGYQFDPASGRERQAGCGPARACRVREKATGALLWP